MHVLETHDTSTHSASISSLLDIDPTALDGNEHYDNCGLYPNVLITNQPAATVQNIHLAIPQSTSKWTKQALAEATERDTDLKQVIELLMSDSVNHDNIAPLNKTVKAYYQQRDRLSVVDGILYRHFWSVSGLYDYEQLVAPIELRQEIIEIEHAGFAASHIGIRKTLARIQKHAYWVGWHDDVIKFIKSCSNCAMYHRGVLPRHAELNPAPTGDVLERLSIDITGPHPKSSRGNHFILTVVDSFSKFAWAFAIRNHTAETVASILVEEILCKFGLPIQILSDNGSEFSSILMQQICKALDIDKLHTVAYKPSTNSTVER